MSFIADNLSQIEISSPRDNYCNLFWNTGIKQQISLATTGPIPQLHFVCKLLYL